MPCAALYVSSPPNLHELRTYLPRPRLRSLVSTRMRKLQGHHISSYFLPREDCNNEHLRTAFVGFATVPTYQCTSNWSLRHQVDKPQFHCLPQSKPKTANTTMTHLPLCLLRRRFLWLIGLLALLRSGASSDPNCNSEEGTCQAYMILGKPTEFTTSTTGVQLAVRRWVPEQVRKSYVI